MCCASAIIAQQQIAVYANSAPEGYALNVEVVTEDIGVLIGALGVTDLTGYSVTRLYVEMVNETDFMSSVSGDITNPTYVETTTNWYHAALGAATPNGINSLLFPVYPDLAYDTWVTIGLEGTPDALAGEANVSTVQSTDNPWTTNFDPGGGLPGANIAIDDAIGGAWYALNGDANGVAGADLQVLIGQFVTTGEISGQVYVQVFIEGDGSNEFRDTFYFGAGLPGCTDATACNYNEAATEDDGSCEYPIDSYGVDYVDCDGNCLTDVDEDGICDEVDDCIGAVDACGICNGPGEIYECGCTDIPDGDCDCNGNQLDACGVCGGTGTDTDADGICDDIDNCTDLSACNYNDAANDACAYLDECGVCGGSGIPDGDCDCDGNVEDICGICGGSSTDEDGDGLGEPCDDNCSDVNACNYNDPSNDACEYDSCSGCGDPDACNYNADAVIINPASCLYPEDINTLPCAGAAVDCDGNCLNDADSDGVCDECEVPGCTDEASCSFDAGATDEDGSCQYPEDIYGDPCTGQTGAILDCSGNCLNDADEDGVCDECEVPGCTDEGACNYDSAATDEDGSCEYLTCAGCTDAGACNFDATATIEDGSCEYSTCAGCMDSAACNYDASATIDDGSCTYTDGICETCENGVIIDNDADDDGVCDADEIPGCQDPAACNYNAAATDSDDSCTYTDGICETCVDGLIVDNDTDDDGVCDADEIPGCEDASACNYNAAATDSDGSCIFTDGICETCSGETDGNGTIVDNDADDDGVCNDDEVFGCTDTIACNFAPLATEEDSTCTYPAEFYLDCDGNCLNDEDEDGLCDEVEALIPPDYNPDWNGDYCYTVADLTHLLCLFGVCGPDTTGGPDYNPFYGEDSCYSAFDLIPFLTLFQTCLEVEEVDGGDTSDSPGPGTGDAEDPMGDGLIEEDDGDE